MPSAIATAFAPSGHIRTTRMAPNLGPRLEARQKATERQKRTLNQEETNVLRVFGFRDLPKGYSEVSGTCVGCDKPFARFSKIGAEMPHRCVGCTRDPKSKAAVNRQAKVAEESTLAEAFQLSAAGWSARLIASHLNQEGFATRRIRVGDWSDTKVRGLLRRPTA